LKSLASIFLDFQKKTYL